ncbi:MAG: glycosyltransferase family 2 protein, partial [Cyanobacteriota bacterium]
VSEQTVQIHHIASIDYHWRIHPGSSSVSLESKPYVPEAQVLVINQHLQRQQLAAEAAMHPHSGFQIRWQVDPQAPIPVLPLTWGQGQASPDELQSCIQSLLTTSHAYLPIEHSLASLMATIDSDWNQSTRLELNCKLLRLGDLMVNRQAKADQEGVLLFVSAQASLTKLEPLAELLSWTSLHPMIGFCGSLVCDSEGKILDAGIIIDDNGRPISLYYQSQPQEPTLFPSPLWYRNWRAASPLCAAIKVRAFAAVGGFPEAPDFQHSFIELCRRIHDSGLRGISNPHSKINVQTSSVADWLKPTDPLGWFVNEPYFNPHLVAGLPIRFA